jgi:glycosyltransferase involved in cell wall biosynthesis
MGRQGRRERGNHLKFCVLIPVFNGAKTIESLIKEIRVFTNNIIIVDDGSTDDTALRAKRAEVTVISHSKNRGKGASLKTGFDYILRETNFEYIIIMDADGQHNPQFIPYFLKTASEIKADIVMGNRMQDVAAMPWIRRLTNKLMSFIISKITKQNIPDSQCGYRLLRRHVLEQINLETSSYDTESEMLFKSAKKHFKIKSIPISTIYGGQKSSINPLIDTFRFIKLLIKLLMLEK